MVTAINRHLDKLCIELAKLIFQARQNFGIYALLGENVSAIKQANRSIFFGYVQKESYALLCLNICKIYESPKDFELVSIPHIVELISDATLASRQNFLEGLVSLGMNKNKVPQLQMVADEKLLKRGIKALHNLRPKEKSSDSLNSLINIRDKWIAHPEYLTVKTVSGPSLNAIEGLLDWSETFLDLVCDSFLHGSGWNIKGDATRVVNATKRIFRDLGIQAQ